MAEHALDGVELRDFPGMINNADRLDMPPGAAELQLNACSLKAGELTVRQGWRQVTFESD
jgi:hypothetical protein